MPISARQGILTPAPGAHRPRCGARATNTSIRRALHLADDDLGVMKTEPNPMDLHFPRIEP